MPPVIIWSNKLDPRRSNHRDARLVGICLIISAPLLDENLRDEIVRNTHVLLRHFTLHFCALTLPNVTAEEEYYVDAQMLLWDHGREIDLRDCSTVLCESLLCGFVTMSFDEDTRCETKPEKVSTNTAESARMLFSGLDESHRLVLNKVLDLDVAIVPTLDFSQVAFFALEKKWRHSDVHHRKRNKKERERKRR